MSEGSTTHRICLWEQWIDLMPFRSVSLLKLKSEQWRGNKKPPNQVEAHEI